jgi:hypothetical protein
VALLINAAVIVHVGTGTDFSGLATYQASCQVKVFEPSLLLLESAGRVRRDSRWRLEYFKLMEASKLNGTDFPEALREINRRCGRVEASFASKLVATLDPSKPVIDRFVLEYFKMRLPRWGSQNREQKTIDLYVELCDSYRDFINGPTGNHIRELFDLRYPHLELSELKKVDLVLWQTRP